jgi:hypothetical protein
LRFYIRNVTLRSVGWKRRGILDPIYARLAAEGHSDARDELARRTGIPGTNLSAINRANRAMTDGYAIRIANAVEGVSPADLGSDAGGGGAQALLTLDRLQALEAAFREEQTARDLVSAALASQLADLEAALAQVAPGVVQQVREGRSTP